MKRTYFLMLVLVVMTACQTETAMLPADDPSSLGAVASIGAHLDREAAVRWTERFQTTYPNEVRAYLFGKDRLQELINRDGAKGIWFFRGLNESSEQKLVLYPADEVGKFLLTNPARGRTEEDAPLDDGVSCPPQCPITGGGGRLQEAIERIGTVIPDATGKQWMAAYQGSHSERTYGHLVGEDILREVLAVAGAQGVWLYNGLTGEGQEKLLLYPADETGEILSGHISGSGPDHIVVSTLPCPIWCSGDGDGD